MLLFGRGAPACLPACESWLEPAWPLPLWASGGLSPASLALLMVINRQACSARPGPASYPAGSFNWETHAGFQLTDPGARDHYQSSGHGGFSSSFGGGSGFGGGGGGGSW